MIQQARTLAESNVDLAHNFDIPAGLRQPLPILPLPLSHYSTGTVCRCAQLRSVCITELMTELDAPVRVSSRGSRSYGARYRSWRQLFSGGWGRALAGAFYYSIIAYQAREYPPHGGLATATPVAQAVAPNTRTYRLLRPTCNAGLVAGYMVVA